MKAIAVKRFTHAGHEFEPDDELDLSPNQASDWQDVGLVTTAPAEPPETAPFEPPVDDEPTD